MNKIAEKSVCDDDPLAHPNNMLERFSEEERGILCDLFTHAHFTKTEWAQVLERTEDLRRSNRSFVADIQRDHVLWNVLRDNGTSPKRKAKRVLRWITERAFPHLSRSEARWKEGLDRLRRPKDIWIPLIRALECTHLEDALECRDERRGDASAWIMSKRDQLYQLRDACCNIMED